MKSKNKITVIASLFVLTSCGATALKNSSEPVETPIHNSVELTDEQMTTMEIETSKVERMNLAYTIETNGTLELPPQNKATLSAIIGGRVKIFLSFREKK